MNPEANASRLSVFPQGRINKIPKRSGEQPNWPTLEGQLVIAFTSRVGSTFLCNHIEQTRAASRIAESFNRRRMQRLNERWKLPSGEHVVAKQMTTGAEKGWFVAKAGVPGLLQAEQMGIVSRYEDITSFWFLLRRDAVAQAVSLGTAKLTGQFHSPQAATKVLSDEDYDEVLLTNMLRNIVNGCGIILQYLSTFDRKFPIFYYENFVNGDFSTVDAELDRLGVPRRQGPAQMSRSQVARLKRDVTQGWMERLRASPKSREYLKKYDEILQEASERLT